MEQHQLEDVIGEVTVELGDKTITLRGLTFKDSINYAADIELVVRSLKSLALKQDIRSQQLDTGALMIYLQDAFEPFTKLLSYSTGLTLDDIHSLTPHQGDLLVTQFLNINAFFLGIRVSQKLRREEGKS